MKFRQLVPDFALPLRQLFRNLHLRHHEQIPSPSGGTWQPVSAQTKTLAALRPRRNFQAHAPFQRRHLKLAAQHSLPWRDFGFVDQIAAFDREIRVARQTHAQKKIAAFPATRPRLTLAGETNALPFMDPLRDLDLITFDLVRIAPPQRDSALRSVERFLECDHDVGFHIASSFRAPSGRCPKLPPPKPPCPRPPPKNASKKSLKPVPPNSNSTPPPSPAL